MKLAVISDIHGNLLALEAVLADIARQGVDQTVNLGDILSGPLQPAETADLLMARDFPTIRGNHDRQLLALLAPDASAMDPRSSDGFAAAQVNAAQAGWLRALPAGRALEPGIRLCHGTPGTDLQYWLETVVPGFGNMGSAGIRPATPEEVRERLGDERHGLVLCGHTHVPRVVQCGGSLVVNPGSVGLQAYGDARPHAHVVETGAPHARYALLEQAPGGWQVDLRAVPYAHEAQAEVARRHGRPDWAHALLTGRMPRA
ncbi:MAG: metallophosphoesterase family protein [Polaromonas sp.]|uniref:metallophosphoesterase family protein n=1 Tax=Polaromonas sp. TaxID=1869339 RepID=UPI0027229FB1|nr:metallophosphoesterase family protein [Polaromonas sp.]MDO9116004.1 metallophosphoesterase family protein [Polaromonas sp.]MDP1886398.1 metallophosphoesterase family protein [Polaromonas sp.]